MTRCCHPGRRKTLDYHQARPRRVPLGIWHYLLADTTARLGRPYLRTKMLTAAVAALAPRLVIRFTPHHSPQWARHPQTFRRWLYLVSNGIHGPFKRTRVRCPIARAPKSRRLCSRRTHGRADTNRARVGGHLTYHNHAPLHTAIFKLLVRACQGRRISRISVYNDCSCGEHVFLTSQALSSDGFATTRPRQTTLVDYPLSIKERRRMRKGPNGKWHRDCSTRISFFLSSFGQRSTRYITESIIMQQHAILRGERID